MIKKKRDNKSESIYYNESLVDTLYTFHKSCVYDYNIPFFYVLQILLHFYSFERWSHVCKKIKLKKVEYLIYGVYT